LLAAARADFSNVAHWVERIEALPNYQRTYTRMALAILIREYEQKGE
jgi:hypothetical protein